MKEKNVHTIAQKVEYYGLVFSLLIIAVAGYRNQVLLFGIPLLVAGYFLCKDSSQIRNFSVLIPLFFLIILGVRIGSGYKLIHILRDYAYFTSPIASFIMGYYIRKYIPLGKFLLILILFGTLYAFFYLFQITFEFNTLFVEDTERTRYAIGTGMPGPAVAIILILFGMHYLKDFKINVYYWILFACINFLTIYYFASRVYYFTLLLYLIPLLYFSSTKKYRAIGNVLFIFLLAGLVGVILIALSGDNFLATKIRNSITEMFIQSFDDYESVIHNWRAYELYEGINTFLGGSGLQKLFGFGFGKTVYLEYELIMPLLTISEIPIFHNGFAYILVKTGLLGVISELLFSIFILYKAYKYSRGDNDLKFIFFLLLPTILSVNFSLLVVNGMFSGESCYLIILAGYLYAVLQKDKHEAI